MSERPYLTLEMDDDGEYGLTSFDRFDEGSLMGGGGPVSAITNIPKAFTALPAGVSATIAKSPLEPLKPTASFIAGSMSAAMQAAAQKEAAEAEKRKWEERSKMFAREKSPDVGFDIFDAFYSPKHRYGYAGGGAYVLPSKGVIAKSDTLKLGLDWAEEFDEMELSGFFGDVGSFLKRRLVRPVAQVARYTAAGITAPFVPARILRKTYGLTARESHGYEIGAKVGRGLLIAAPVVAGAVILAGSGAGAAAGAGAAGVGGAGIEGAGITTAAGTTAASAPLVAGAPVIAAGEVIAPSASVLAHGMPAALGAAQTSTALAANTALSGGTLATSAGLSAKLAIGAAAAKTGLMAGVMKLGTGIWHFANSPLGIMSIMGFANSQAPAEAAQMEEGTIYPTDAYQSLLPPIAAGGGGIQPWDEEVAQTEAEAQAKVKQAAMVGSVRTILFVGVAAGMIAVVKKIVAKKARR